MALLAFLQTLDSNMAVGRRPKEGQRPQGSSREAIKILKRQKLWWVSHHTLCFQSIFMSVVFYYCEEDGKHCWSNEKQQELWQRGCKTSSYYTNNCNNKPEWNENTLIKVMLKRGPFKAVVQTWSQEELCWIHKGRASSGSDLCLRRGYDDDILAQPWAQCWNSTLLRTWTRWHCKAGWIINSREGAHISGRTNNEDETGKCGVSESIPKGRIVHGRWRGGGEDNGRRSIHYKWKDAIQERK